MEITVKKIGWNRGTCGWLANGLADGSIRFEEKTCKKACYGLGLFLSYRIDESEKTSCLACYDPYQLSDERSEYAKYDTLDHDDPIGGTRFEELQLTDAAEKAIFEVAKQWVEQMNDQLESDASAPELSNIRLVRE